MLNLNFAPENFNQQFKEINNSWNKKTKNFGAFTTVSAQMEHTYYNAELVCEIKRVLNFRH